MPERKSPSPSPKLPPNFFFAFSDRPWGVVWGKSFQILNRTLIQSVRQKIRFWNFLSKSIFTSDTRARPLEILNDIFLIDTSHRMHLYQPWYISTVSFASVEMYQLEIKSRILPSAFDIDISFKSFLDLFVDFRWSYLHEFISDFDEPYRK